MGVRLAYVFGSLTRGSSVDERVGLVRELGLGLSVAPDEVELVPDGVDVRAVHAVGLKRWHSLSATAEERQRAAEHVRACVEAAVGVGAGFVVTVACYGVVDGRDAVGRAAKWYAPLCEVAREAGVRLLVEPLSSRRTNAFDGPEQVAELLDVLDDPAVGLLLDTGHLADGGRSPAAELRRYRDRVTAVQLRGPMDAAPRPGAELAACLEALPPDLAHVSIEHHEALSPDEVRDLVAWLAARLP